MTEPFWLRGAALTAALAGLAPDEAVVGFAPIDAAGIRAALARMRRSGDRVRTANAVAREAIELIRSRSLPLDVTAVEHSRTGVVALASVVAALPAARRAEVARRFAPSFLRAAAANAKLAVKCNGAEALRVLACASRVYGRMPDASETGSLIATALAIADRSEMSLSETALRCARVLGAAPARAFAPFAIALPPRSEPP